MDLITLRFIERILAVIIGGLAVFLGYQLFVKIPESRDSQGKITLPWGISVILSRVGPGVFFALFGVAVVTYSLHKGLEFSEQKSVPSAEVKGPAPTTGTVSEVHKFIWGAAPTPEGEQAARADARALLQREIAILNNITHSLRADLPDYERTPIEFAIPRIKFALMKPMWGEAAEGWGTPSEFENWLKDGEPDPPPSHIAKAVEYYRYARGGAKP
jgi:hypothetical protein